MKLTVILAMAVVFIPIKTQAQRKAEVFSGQDIMSQLEMLAQKAKGSGSSGSTLLDDTSHAIMLSVRTASGAAEIHADYDDIFLVTEGKADLVTGGNVVDAKMDSHGETKGRSIRNGKSQTIVKGDVVHIPAGVPHQLILAPGSEYSSIVMKIRESSEQRE